MKILKTEPIEEYVCPRCKGALEFDCNEKSDKIKKFLFLKWITYTDNAWFECERCNKRYLIKDYAFPKEAVK